jgi:hypothetical protein
MSLLTQVRSLLTILGLFARALKYMQERCSRVSVLCEDSVRLTQRPITDSLRDPLQTHTPTALGVSFRKNLG